MEMKLLNSFNFGSPEELPETTGQSAGSSLSGLTVQQGIETFGITANLEQMNVSLTEKENKFVINDKVYYFIPESKLDLGGKFGGSNLGLVKQINEKMQFKFVSKQGIYNLVFATDSEISFYSSEGTTQEVYIRIYQFVTDRLGGEISQIEKETYKVGYMFGDTDTEAEEQKVITNRNVGAIYPKVRGLEIPARPNTPPTLKRVNFNIKNDSLANQKNSDLFGKLSEVSTVRSTSYEDNKVEYYIPPKEIKVIDVG